MKLRPPAYGRRKDENHNVIERVFRDNGWGVKNTHYLGNGFPDFIAYTPSSWLPWTKVRARVLVEVKMPGEELTSAETTFHATDLGEHVIVTWPTEVLGIAAHYRKLFGVEGEV